MTVTVSNRQRRFEIDGGALARALEAVLAGCGEVEQEVAVLLLSDRSMRPLNHSYRGLDEPTDVLSFAMREGEFGDRSGRLLGDLAISLESVARQAGESHEDGRPATGTPQRELALMAIHGLLHLLGHDHLRRADARRMVEREEALFAAYWTLFPSFAPRAVKASSPKISR